MSWFDKAVDWTSNAISTVQNARIAKEPRYPQTDRVPTTYRTLSSVTITPDSAVTISAVWACLRYLSQTVAVLPWHVVLQTEKGLEVQTRHPIDYVINDRVSPEWSSFQFRETMMHWALRWGNAYAEIEFNSAGRPAAMWPIHPERVKVCRDPETNALFYEVDGKLEFNASEMFHLRGFGEGVVGVNVVTYAAECLGWAKAAQMFGASFFGNGMNINGVVKVKKELSIPALKKLKEELAGLYKGIRNANRTAVLDQDMEWEQVSVDPNKAQFIQTNQHLVEEVCRWFGVPPHKIMHLLRGTFSNIEHQSIEVVVDSVSPWAKRLEDEANFKLFGANRQGLKTKLYLQALMRGDTAARGAWYKMMREVGALSVNDILRLEDMNTIGKVGDKRVMNSTYTTLERIGEEPVKTVAAPPEPEEPDDEDEDTSEDDEAEEELNNLYLEEMIHV